MSICGSSTVGVVPFVLGVSLMKYSKDLKSGQVQILNGQKQVQL